MRESRTQSSLYLWFPELDVFLWVRSCVVRKGVWRHSARMAALGLLNWFLTVLFLPQHVQFLISFGVKRKLDRFLFDTWVSGTILLQPRLFSTKRAKTKESGTVELNPSFPDLPLGFAFFSCWLRLTVWLPISGDRNEFSLCLQSHFWEVESGGSPSAEAPHLAVFASPHHGSRLCQGAAVDRWWVQGMTSSEWLENIQVESGVGAGWSDSSQCTRDGSCSQRTFELEGHLWVTRLLFCTCGNLVLTELNLSPNRVQ